MMVTLGMCILSAVAPRALAALYIVYASWRCCDLLRRPQQRCRDVMAAAVAVACVASISKVVCVASCALCVALLMARAALICSYRWSTKPVAPLVVLHLANNGKEPQLRVLPPASDEAPAGAGAGASGKGGKRKTAAQRYGADARLRAIRRPQELYKEQHTACCESRSALLVPTRLETPAATPAANGADGDADGAEGGEGTPGKGRRGANRRRKSAAGDGATPVELFLAPLVELLRSYVAGDKVMSYGGKKYKARKEKGLRADGSAAKRRVVRIPIPLPSGAATGEGRAEADEEAGGLLALTQEDPDADGETGALLHKPYWEFSLRPCVMQLVPWRGDDDDGSGAATTTPAGSGSPRSPLHEDAELRRTATALAHLHDEIFGAVAVAGAATASQAAAVRGHNPALQTPYGLTVRLAKTVSEEVLPAIRTLLGFVLPHIATNALLRHQFEALTAKGRALGVSARKTVERSGSGGHGSGSVSDASADVRAEELVAAAHAAGPLPPAAYVTPAPTVAGVRTARKGRAAAADVAAVVTGRGGAAPAAAALPECPMQTSPRPRGNC
eukprot:XP_001699517.1 predicted protein [Chlamydomonas reinhardtii]